MILILAIVAILGICYPVKIFDIQLTALLGRVFADFSVAVVFLLAGIFLFTFLFGRLYCSTICPFGILQEIAALIFRKKNSFRKNLPVKYFIAALTFGSLIGGSALFIRYIDPYTIFGSAISLSAIGVIVTAAVLAVVFFKNRFFCTNICPVGAILGLFSKFSVYKIFIDKEKCGSCGLCAKACPSGCINEKEKFVDNETCIKCLKCLKECRKEAIKYGLSPQTQVKFSGQRRELIFAASALVVFGGALKAGIEIGKNFAKKVRDIILPPGALNTSHMANKCLNCNLCIENCPNKILAKADSEYPAVHIDYSQGEGWCKYDCNQCSNVCPSGALKRLSLKEKQKTRIAMAMINDEKCTQCGVCTFDCPLGAITKTNGKTLINGSLCIGCARCTKSCKFGAIEIFAVKEQKII